MNEGADEGAATEAPASQEEKKQHRMFQNSWKTVMVPGLLLVVSALVAAGLSVCPSEKGADFVGCSECAAMFCSTCQLNGEHNTFTSGCRNFFHRGA